MVPIAETLRELSTHHLDLLLALASGAEPDGSLPQSHVEQVSLEKWGEWADYDLLFRQQLIFRRHPFQFPQRITPLGMNVVLILRPIGWSSALQATEGNGRLQ